MELLDPGKISKSVLGLLAVIGVVLSGALFTSVTKDSDTIQAILLSQQASEIKLNMLVEDMNKRDRRIDKLEDFQRDIEKRLYSHEEIHEATPDKEPCPEELAKAAAKKAKAKARG